MTTKKILLIIGGIAAVLGLLVVLFVGGIVWIAFSTIGKSEAAGTAKDFLQQNEKLKSDIGEVRDFGFWITGNINSNNSDGEATLNLKVIGAKKTVPASVNLTYRNGREWVVVKASYRNDAGQTVDLTNAYELDAQGGSEPNDAVTHDSDGADDVYDEESFAELVTQSEGITLVAVISQYSQTLEKILDELETDYAGRVSIARYSVDKLPAVPKHFKVGKMPTIILYKGGKERERRTGTISKQQLAALLDKYLETE